MANDHETVTKLDAFDAPWGKQVELQNVEFEGGLSMLRMRMREGRRFTIIDLDKATAEKWGQSLKRVGGKTAGLTHNCVRAERAPCDERGACLLFPLWKMTQTCPKKCLSVCRAKCLS